VRDRLDRFGDAAVAVVLFDSTDRLGAYRAHLDLPERIRLLADPDRRTYEAFDIGRGTRWQVWGHRTLLAYARLAARGRRIQRHRGDPLQLGGDVVISRDGRISYLYRPPDPDARPPVEDLVRALR